MYDITGQAVSGELLQVIRSVDDMEGLEAWHRWTGKCSPKSMARAERLVGQVTNPPRVSDLNEAESEVGEDPQARLQGELLRRREGRR